jgi:DNA polymerase III subunit gamma/tau
MTQPTKDSLNLARKWRPKNFDQIIGQEIPVRMLQNGLFLQKTFPVYLFAGQRGCGKTTTARVFAAAVNCQNLKKFQEKPTENKIPCLECDSCKAMMQANHPDFIEIDAASHTGVENVRQILEACTYMPLFGTKKIYLIDEAHMLSKAAFNAFLKILEEPPASALFILATTELQKFPETVLSRCFHVIFKPVDNTTLKEHLKDLCTKEAILIQDQALEILIQETEGSVRDAINLLERVRFSEKEVSVESILHVLGKLSEKELLTLFENLIDQKPKELLEQLNSATFQTINPQTLWNMIIQVCRSLLWIKFGTSTNLPMYFNDLEHLQKTATKCSLNRLNSIFQLLWSQEDLFLRTPNKQIFLEILLLQICQQINVSDIQEILNLIKNEQPKNPAPRQLLTEQPKINSPILINNKPEEKEIPTQNIATNTQDSAIDATKSVLTKTQDGGWTLFLANVSKQINDPFLISAINQIQFLSKNEEKKLITASITNNSTFLKDSINEKKDLWLPFFKEQFPNYTGLEFVISENAKKLNFNTNPAPVSTPNTTPKSESIPSKPHFSTQSVNKFKSSGQVQKSEAFLNISNTDLWPKSNLLTKYFPGKIKIVKNYN